MDTHDQLTIRNRLLETTVVLDCYRAVLLQVLPGMPSQLCRLLVPTSNTNGFPLWQPSPMSRHADDREAEDSEAVIKADRISLAFIALMVPRFIPPTNRPLSDTEPWRSEFVQLALQDFGKNDDLSVPDILLYHVTNISLHVSLDLLQCFARSRSDETTTAMSTALTARMQDWHCSTRVATAHWHASRVMLETQKALSEQAKAYALPCRTMREESIKASTLGAPHIPYSIYHATLILWSASVISENTKMERALLLQTGSHVLCSLQARVARVLANALLEIKHE